MLFCLHFPCLCSASCLLLEGFLERARELPAGPGRSSGKRARQVEEMSKTALRQRMRRARRRTQRPPHEWEVFPQSERGRSQTLGRSRVGRPSARASVTFGVRHRWRRGLRSQFVHKSMRLNEPQISRPSSACAGGQCLPNRNRMFIGELGSLGVRMPTEQKHEKIRSNARSPQAA